MGTSAVRSHLTNGIEQVGPGESVTNKKRFVLIVDRDTPESETFSSALRRAAFSVLIRASMGGNLDIVDALLAAGADPNAQDNNGRTPLIWASLRNHTEVVTTLVKNGAEVDHREERGCTALIEAAFRGHLETVQQLLDFRADIIVRDKDDKVRAHEDAVRGCTVQQASLIGPLAKE